MSSSSSWENKHRLSPIVWHFISKKVNDVSQQIITVITCLISARNKCWNQIFIHKLPFYDHDSKSYYLEKKSRHKTFIILSLVWYLICRKCVYRFVCKIILYCIIVFFCIPLLLCIFVTIKWWYKNVLKRKSEIKKGWFLSNELTGECKI